MKLSIRKPAPEGVKSEQILDAFLTTLGVSPIPRVARTEAVVGNLSYRVAVTSSRMSLVILMPGHWDSVLCDYYLSAFVNSEKLNNLLPGNAVWAINGGSEWPLATMQGYEYFIEERPLARESLAQYARTGLL